MSSPKSGLFRQRNQVLKHFLDNDAILCTGESNSRISSNLFILIV